MGVLTWEFGPAEADADRVRRAFRAFGFVIVRGVFGRAELVQVRAALDDAFDSTRLRDLGEMVSTELLKHPAIWECLFKESVVTPLRAALGPELCYQNDLHVQRNSYGQAGIQRHRGWHMDAGSETYNRYLRSPGYRFAKCGIFLQDFDNGWGGGIRVKPKSHRWYVESGPIKQSMFRFRWLLDRAAIRAGVDFDTLHVPTRAGDLCFFDSRLWHSSVLPNPANIRKIGYDSKRDVGTFWPAIPSAHTKYVVYWDACNQAMVDDFLCNSISRSENEPSGMKEELSRPAAFTRFLALRYPDDYPAEFVATARRFAVNVASLDHEQAAFYKRKLRSMQLLHP